MINIKQQTTQTKSRNVHQNLILFHFLIESEQQRYILFLQNNQCVYIIQYLQMYSQELQSQKNKRKNRFSAIRQSLKQNPILKTNTIAIQNKLQKRRKRRQSVSLTENLTQSQKNLLLEQDDIQVKAMSKFHQKYIMGEKIGEGANGVVKKCYLKSNNQLYAVKAMGVDQEHIIFLKSNFKQIHALDHPNIIKYKSMYLDIKSNICYLVMDYITTPNLLQCGDLAEDEIKLIIQQLLDTLAYVHSCNICHRDIKPDNILFDREKKRITLIDFGISKNIEKRGAKKQMLTITGTLYYRAPQMFSGGGYDQKVDVWAVGITLFQLITGKTPFESQYLSTTIENIQKAQINFEDKIWDYYGKSAKDLVIRLLKKRPQRMTAQEAKKHFWFNKRPNNSIDLAKSDSLDLKLGQFLTVNAFQKCADDSGKIFSQKKLALVDGNFKKKFMEQSSEDDSLIEIQSQGDCEGDSPPFLQNTSLCNSINLINHQVTTVSQSEIQQEV